MDETASGADPGARDRDAGGPDAPPRPATKDTKPTSGKAPKTGTKPKNKQPRNKEPSPAERVADLLPGLRALATAVTGSAHSGGAVVAAAVAEVERRGARLGEPESWLLTAVTNRSVARATRSHREYLPELFARVAGRRDEASMLAVRSTLARLAPADRAALVLRYVRDLDDEAAARTLGWRRIRLPARLWGAMNDLGAALAATGHNRPSDDPHRWDQIADALRAFLAGLPDAPAATAARARRHARPWLPAAAALLPGLALLATVVTASFATSTAVSTTGAGGYLPSRLPAYSPLTGFADATPPGPALLAWEQTATAGPLHTTQLLVLGEQGRDLRRVAQAETAADGADTRPTLLAPDGRLLALGTAAGNGVLELLDLTTGKVTSRSPLGRGDVWPAAWDPTGRQLWVVRSHGDGGTPAPGTLVRVSAQDGSSTELEGVEPIDPRRVATSPDARYLAVQGAEQRVLDTTSAAVVTTWDIDGSLLRNGWSPDGSRLLVSTPGGLAVVALSGTAVVGSPVPLPGLPADATVLGWRSGTTALVAVPGGPGRPPQLLETDVGTGDTRVASSVPSGWPRLETAGVSLATRLLPDLTGGDPLPVDRGPVPPRWWVGISLLLAAGLLLARRFVLGTRHRMGSLRW